MIRYALKCGNTHDFDSWFASAEGFDMQQAAGLVACPVCNSTDVEKSVMAPNVAPGLASRTGAERTAAAPEASSPPDRPEPARKGGSAGPLSEPASGAERAMAELRRKIEATTEDVGDSFARVARQMHEGEVDPRAIRGRTSFEEARKLHEDGVPVLPLPFGTRRRSN
ncbi:hypothetical protein BV394_06155 [Brevirhabdus pacifica]|uniref:Uncharacterized protein n=3 Tax=Brevirhabdus pacifica TaxID=1267768 RepID=A0A1U7DLZ8_9RHOB|nr:DUF1178 family protein [Brevirhabdus pacifica]APX91002.1 hypothetical protein BV394_06155 [Brevirhabdus pacifica]OWU76908.1 hypothetical protein ATO5_10135 [Loktanella sp. 22II-4b]PJJ86023.1 hypothetical protein CLV77_0555 [Brevirhabdus pacifica]